MWGSVAEEIDLATYKVAQESKFLSENIVYYSLEKKPKYVFIFHRGQRALVKAIAASMHERLSCPAPKPEQPLLAA